MDSVVIIGAGIAGLAAASLLFEHNFNNVTIFEAQDYVGGRIRSLPFGDNVLEIGAQSIHGQKNNILFEMASKRELINHEEHGREGEGLFCTQEATLLNSETINPVVMFLNSIKTNLSNGIYPLKLSNGQTNSVGNIFRSEFESYLKERGKSICSNNLNLYWAIYNWYIKFEMIDNCCYNLDDLSTLSYSNYCQCEGVPYIHFKSGFSTIIDLLMEKIPADWLKLNHPVDCVDFSSSNSDIEVHLKNGLIFRTNYVIITASVGFLKDNLDHFFKPKLPQEKHNLIQSIGFGTANKIFLQFQKPFWSPNTIGFQLIWLNSDDTAFPSWAYDITGFEEVAGQPNFLLAWIGGKGAQFIEQLDDSVIAEVCWKILSTFLKSIIQVPIEKPSKIIKSTWHTNPYFKGSYSYRTIKYQELEFNKNSLVSPVCKKVIKDGKAIEWPCLLFAGEATNEAFFSTAHGALESGYGEAQRIINFRKDLQL